jgi:Kdo2-lipid IVA lauroyltransferase/acyltransferase
MTAWVHKHHPWRKFLRSLRYFVEGLPLFVIFGIFWLLPVDWASNLGGWLARQIGGRLAVNRRAREHLKIAFPDLSETEQRRILLGMWDNLGRLAAEYPHLGKLADPKSGRCEVIGLDHLEAARRSGRPIITVSAHIANFELLAPSAYRHGLDLTAMARRINNPIVQAIVQFFRDRSTGTPSTIPKGVSGGRQALRLVEQGVNLGALLDHRASQGVPLPLFGRPARTTLGIAKLAIDKNLALLPVQIERRGGARFRITVEPPVEAPELGDRQAEAEFMMTEVNRTFERWIRNRPEDWLWLHRRWTRP